MMEMLLQPFEDQRVALTYGKQRGPAEAHFSERQIYDNGLRYEDLVRAADVVVTKPGYGIISEAIANDERYQQRLAELNAMPADGPLGPFLHMIGDNEPVGSVN